MWDLYKALRTHSDGPLRGRVFNPLKSKFNEPGGLLFAVRVLQDAIHPPPENLLPLMPVCDSSFACVVCDRDISDGILNKGEAFEVVRWHVGLVDERKQGELLDIDPIAYLASVSEEFSTRDAERIAVEKTAANYYQEYVVAGRRPKVDALRPVQLACQNVIIGLASLRHDPIFDGLRVEAYATCEVAHLATGEADRAMAALLLCDAFQSGGTMEIRFGPPGRREHSIPQALDRYARARGLRLGAGDPHSISPIEARELFLTVTPMPDELRFRAFEAFDTGQITPERLCYALMAGIWSQIEVAYMLATTTRAASILEGGCNPQDRLARCAETEICRAALMIGMLLRRLENTTESTKSTSHVFMYEDWRLNTDWAIQSDQAAVAFTAVSGQSLPWYPPGGLTQLPVDREAIVVLPRGMPQPSDVVLLNQIQIEQPEAAVFLLVPDDADLTALGDVPCLLCPQNLSELDQVIRQKLDALRIARR